MTQPDLGFRAAAARNLAARACQGEILAFLDADTVPEPGFVAALTDRVSRCRDVLAVGRRRHAGLDRLPVDADPTTAPELPEPSWLREGYAASRDLLDADGRSFRFVISAVMACRRDLFEELGGFDERFVGYGGEDWDFAYRAWNAGAVLVHEPSAVAWHDGPEWAGREEHRAGHDRQSMRLAALIPEPSIRGVALPGLIPDVLVDLDLDLEPDPDAGGLVRCVHSVLRQDHRDLRVRLPADVDPSVAGLYAGQTQVGEWGEDQLHRARARLRIAHPLPRRAVGDAMRMITDDDIGIVEILVDGVRAATLTSTRASARVHRWRHEIAGDVAMAGLFGVTTLEVGRPPPARDDLAGYFARG